MCKIADILGISLKPVAIYRQKTIPEDASVPTDHCSIPPLLMKCARLGTKCAADKEHTFCHGALSGLGFGGMFDREHSCWIASDIPEEHKGELNHRGKGEFKSPDIAKLQLDAIKDYGDGTDAIVFQELDSAMGEDRPIEVVVFLVDPTRLSALALLAGYSKSTPGPAATMPYGHACQQIYALPRSEGESDDPHAIIGMTDIYARRFVPSDILSFAVPFSLYERMDRDIDGSYFCRGKWPEMRDKCL